MVPRSVISRRRFAGAVAAAASALALDAKSARANSVPALPPAIAALPVLSGQARPFTNAEQEARVERAQALMAAEKIDAIVLANGTNSSVYFADLRLNSGERLWALVIPARAKPFLELQHMLAGCSARQAEPFGRRGEPASFDHGRKNPCVFKAIHRKPVDCQPIVDNLFRAAPIINAIFSGMGDAAAATKSRKRRNPDVEIRRRAAFPAA